MKSHATMLKVVCLVMEDPSGKLFLAKRAKGKSLADYWELPGGKIKQGESPSEALLREIFEELGIEIDIVEKLPSSIADHGPMKIELMPFKGKKKNGELVLREHQDSIWVKPTDAQSLKLAPADVPIIKALAAEEKSYQST
jgi:8-oxo-dGTP diphosphatase